MSGLVRAWLATSPAGRTAPAAQAAVSPDDYCGGQCSDILPPGEQGSATLAEILAHKLLGTRPAHSADQLGKYSSLAGGYKTLTIDVAPDTTYLVAARLNEDQRDNPANGAYWDPVVWKEVAETCR